MKELWCDPKFTGKQSTGSSTHPLKTLIAPGPDATWAMINEALAKSDVTIYLNSTSGEAGSLKVWRMDKSSHRLTLDGMSRYRNAGWGKAPVSKYSIWDGMDIGIGINSEMIDYPMHNTTLRGFFITGNGSKMAMCGNNVIAEDIEMKDITGQDPCILFHNAIKEYSCEKTFGNMTNLIWRRITIDGCKGEGGYVGGNYYRKEDGGCPEWKNTHRNILIEDFVVIDAGKHGAQGDSLDLKAGLMDVTIRRFKSIQTDGGVRMKAMGARALVSSGIFDVESNRSNFLIEDCESNFGDFVLSYVNGGLLRGNKIANGVINTNCNGETDPAGNPIPKNFNLQLISNQLENAGISLLQTSGAEINKNLMKPSAFMSAHGNCSNINSNGNILPKAMGFDNWTEGPDSVYY